MALLVVRLLATFLQLEALIPREPNWSYEKLRACLYWDEKKQEKADQDAEAEIIAAGGFDRVGKSQGRFSS